ncbi:PUB domain [Seminavis robusta]|uniref:PUB domain n=1 Tax=Seminavis robusta TaxID=568900 RepID=A0A9N8DZG4_9STRA|nr:PUB domain [Seminavis robusta]|eukprot:Sro399_g134860.1 PUB domain (411) ;mRNA; f:22819-24169
MAEDSVTVNLTVTATPAAPRIPLTIPKDVTPTSLRKLTSEASKIPLDKLRLIFRGRLIGDDDKKNAVTEFKLEEGTVLHCMGKPEGDTTTATAAAAPAATASAGSSVTIQPTAAATAPAASSSNPLQAAFTTLRSNNPPQTYMTAVTTLDKILNNIVTNPMEEKYRRVKKQNPAFQKRLGGLTGGDAAMKGAGFIVEMDNGEENYVMHASAEKWPELMAAKTAVEVAVRDAKAAANQASAPPPVVPLVGGMPNFGAMPGLGGGAMPGLGGAGMPPGMQQMMSDPNFLQNMLQNPMVQNAIRNDPRFAGDPMMRQSMETLANNPAMVQQIATMMRDPQMQQRMQQMAAAGGMGGFGGAGMPPFGAVPNNNASPGTNNNQQQQNAPGANDQDQTEEEMIAEAIRRSLEEGGA